MSLLPILPIYVNIAYIVNMSSEYISIMPWYQMWYVTNAPSEEGPDFGAGSIAKDACSCS